MKKQYRYLIYWLSGWFLEILYTGLGSLFIHGDIRLRCQTYIWMFFIYGLAIFIEPIHNKIRILPVILRGVVYVVVIFSIEYLTGYMLKNITGVCPWNYGNNRFSIQGIIELDFAPVWFLLGLFFEKLHDFLIRFRLIKINENLDHKHYVEKLHRTQKILNSTILFNKNAK